MHNMSIEQLNEFVKRSYVHLDIALQAYGRFVVGEMHIEVHCMLNGERHPIRDALAALCELRMEPDQLSNLKERNSACIGKIDGNHFCYIVAGRAQNAAVIAAYGQLTLLILPSVDRWHQSGFSWLLDHCPVCEGKRDKSMPWLKAPCRCASQEN